MKIGDEMGGNIVLGNVEGKEEIVERKDEGEEVRLKMREKEEMENLIEKKGYVEIEGN